MSEEFYDELDGQEMEFEEEIEEEISTAEVDKVLESLSNLMEKVESETIHEYLEDAYNHVFSLVYEDEAAEDAEVGDECAGDEETSEYEEDEFEDEDEYEDEEYDGEDQAEAA